MKSAKRLLSLLLASAMIVGLAPANVMAAKKVEPEEPKYQPVVMEEGEEWVQTTVVEDGKEYVIVAGEEDIALANDEMKVEAAEVKVEDEKVTEFNENAVWTWDEETGLFTQEEKAYVKVIDTIFADQDNIDGLEQELKADEETGLVMLQMKQDKENKRLVYKKDEFKAVKVDKKDIDTKNSLRLFVKTTEEDRKAMEAAKEEAVKESSIMTLEAPMDVAPLEEGEEWVQTNNLEDIKSGKPCVVVAFNENKALVLMSGDGAGATTLDVNISGDKLVDFDENLNSDAVLKWNDEFESLSRGNDVLTAKQYGEGVTTNNFNANANKAKYDVLDDCIQISSVPDPAKVVAFKDGTFKSVVKSSITDEQKMLRIFVKGGSGSSGGDAEPTGITLAPENATLTVGNTLKLTATITPDDANKTLTWKSSDETIATVNNGTVTAVKEGTAIITAETTNNLTATATIKVEPIREELTAEFYVIDKRETCTYVAQAKDSEVFTANPVSPTGATFLGSAKLEGSVLGNTNLLSEEDILKTWNVSDQEWAKELQQENRHLYEVRSGKRAVYTNNGDDRLNGAQYVYATGAEIATDKAYNYYGIGDAAANGATNIYCPKADDDNKPQPIANATLVASQRNDNTIKYIYLKETLATINYHVMDKDNKPHLVASTDGVFVTNTIIMPNFVEDPMFSKGPFTDVDAKVLEYTGLNRNQLVAEGMELYTDGELKEKFTTGIPLTFVMQDSSKGDEYVLNLYYGEPLKAGSTSIQLPVKMYDFDADGMFFEFCSGLMENSYGYGMWNGGDSGDGLVEPNLDPKVGNAGLKYSKKAYDQIAALIHAGKMWNGTDEEGGVPNDKLNAPEIPTKSKYIREKVTAVKDTLGTYDDVVKVLADGKVDTTEITNCYTAAAYMFMHFFEGDGTYGKPVDQVTALELKEYKNFDGTSYYIYDANWKSKVEKGVIQNELGENNYFQNATEQGDWGSAYYMPLDWAGVSDDYTYDQYSNANFLFTTVGEGAFIYEETKDLEFTFKGDDDVYLFINGHLALDIGGAHSALEDTVKLNEHKDEWGLANGEAATFTFFHMERHGTGSNFRMITNINISSPSLLTHKFAYDENGDVLENGSHVDADAPYYYAFRLSNDGERNMFNLSFWDQDLDVGLYPLGHTGDFTSKYSEALDSWGDLVLEIYTEGKDGDGNVILNYPDIPRYKFVKADGDKGWHPSIEGDKDNTQNPTPDLADGDCKSFGQVNRVKVSDLYKTLSDLYPNVYAPVTDADKELKYRNLMEEVIRNGIAPGQKMIVSGLKHSIPAGEVFRNEVQTYGSDWEKNEIHGSDTHTVYTDDLTSIVKVIDYGKPVTYSFGELFKTFTDGSKYTDIKLNTGDPKPADPRPTAATGNTYKAGYKWVDNADGTGKLVKTDEAMDVSETTVKRGDGVGCLWRSGNDVESTKFTFVPDAFMDQYAKFALQVDREMLDAETKVDILEPYWKYLTIYPANVVYYEDNFVATGSDSSTGIIYTGSKAQQGTDNVFEQDSDAGTQDNADIKHNGDQQYGYDKNYDATSGAGDSNGTSMKLENNGEYAKASFTFKGTGFDIVGRTDEESTVITYTVKDENNKLIKMGAVDTLYMNGRLYQIPVIHVEDLAYGEYTVSLTVTQQTGRNVFYLDGVRIYNPMGDSNTPYLDSEEDATVEKLNKLVLNNGQITEQGIVDADGKLISTTGIEVEGARAALANITVDDGKIQFLPITYTEDADDGNTAISTDTLVSVLRHGPNNEIYLPADGAIVLVVDGNPYDEGQKGTLQVEAKLVSTGTASADTPKANISYLTNNDGTASWVNKEVNTSTAMYYEIPKEAFIETQENSDKYFVVIRGGEVVDGLDLSHVISFSNIKYKGCGITENPVSYADENDILHDEWFDTVKDDNKYLSDVEVSKMQVSKNDTVTVTIKKPSDLSQDDWEHLVKAVKQHKDYKDKFKITSQLSTEDVKNVNYVKGSVEEKNGVLTFDMKAPKVSGVYTITLRYNSGNEDELINAFSFSLNVNAKTKGKKA